MKKITNKPGNDTEHLRYIRNFFEHRALWLYFLCGEAKKKGFSPDEFAPEAIKRCGLFHGGLSAAGSPSKSLKNLKKAHFRKAGQNVFEMKILRCTDTNFDVDFHYCPLVAAWQKQGCTQEEMEKLCDYAMWGDRGIAESYGARLELPKTIARGDGVCQIRFIRDAG
ncbi:L-2-amino-thiazoline-4-carboxylic acid hydrolase [Treponema sp. OttesenSCG-928-L16]|nr:L-2-amino-thiazoline-4-carboxylic acid hydrolase [Treponema sp. OttesenSCG-928-L16]